MDPRTLGTRFGSVRREVAVRALGALLLAAVAAPALVPAVGAQPIPDVDYDGLLDEDELAVYGTDPHNPDSDGDGLTDREEAELGTDPNNTDTDGDGVGDLYDAAPLTWSPYV